MKKFLGLVALAAFGLVAVILVRTFRFTPPPIEAESPFTFEVDAVLVARHLSEAVKFRTISPPTPARREDRPFDEFLIWTEATYPELHAQLEKTLIAKHTLLFKWPGQNPALKPILLAAHYDVVPVVPGTEENWAHPPFDGVIADGHVWGRGALDNKSAVVVIMEAASLLLRQKFQPQRTVYLAFDHDEEIGGREGAAGVTAFLKGQGVSLAWSIDEGSFILKGAYPGMKMPVARISVAEKGYMTLDLVAHGDSGHSSIPTKDASIFLLATAINRLRETSVPGELDGVSLQAMDTIARHYSFSRRLLFANRWLFQGVIEKAMSKSGPANAALRTTTAPTLLSAGVKDNVLPGKATATVNFRLHDVPFATESARSAQCAQ